MTVRYDRTRENFGRGFRLIRRIRRLKRTHGRMPKEGHESVAAIRKEYDITLPEWHYWCTQAGEEAARTECQSLAWLTRPPPPEES
jgi:hypothetical protein